ncbi:MAG TPA: penicillin-binding protein 2 [Gaiellaceae bacterium]|nr:penicillin-binding protein 2 [Gaiellaceae bacterium]
MASAGSRARVPRFLPPDPRVEQPYLFTPKMALRVAILGVVAIVVVGVLLLRLWSLEVLSGSKFRAEALDNQLRTVSLEAPRGPILDSRGRVLVRNVISKAVVVWPGDLPKRRGRDTELRQLAKVLNMSFAQVRALLRSHRPGDVTTPVTLKVSVHPEQIYYILEHAAQFRGVQIKPTYLRYYNSEDALAQVLGYVSRIDARELARDRQACAGKGYPPDDRIGKSGVEAAYDTYLHGCAGEAELRVDSAGRQTSPLYVHQQPQAGAAVRLTIDIRLQRAAENALAYGIRIAQGTSDGWAADGGAFVAMDVNTGAMLAMASSPTYAPRVWVNRDPKELAPLLDQTAARRANYPAIDRVIDAAYPPGSTFKPVTALAALEENIVSPYQPLLCSPTYSAPNPYGGPRQVFRNWNPYVSSYMTMATALEQSCDTYFYQLGYDFYQLPANRGQPLQKWAERFGFGKQPGIDIGPQATGLVPTIEWKKKAFTSPIDRAWKPGDSIQLAIGQKDVLVTPLQLVRFYAMLANGGKLVTPHVVADVERPSPGGSGAPTVLRSFQPPAPTPTGVDPSYLQVVRQGLYDATHDPLGTSYGTFGHFPVPVAGKTGTAEKVVTLPGETQPRKLNQSLWCGYAPADRPTVAVCVVIENGGHGAEAAAPAAAKWLAQYFGTTAQASPGTASD